MHIIATIRLDRYKTDAICREYRAVRDAARVWHEKAGSGKPFEYPTFHRWLENEVRSVLMALTATFPGETEVKVNKIIIEEGNNADLL
jgi:hypothetical protein